MNAMVPAEILIIVGIIGTFGLVFAAVLAHHLSKQIVQNKALGLELDAAKKYHTACMKNAEKRLKSVDDLEMKLLARERELNLAKTELGSAEKKVEEMIGLKAKNGALKAELNKTKAILEKVCNLVQALPKDMQIVVDNPDFAEFETDKPPTMVACDPKAENACHKKVYGRTSRRLTI
jgi:hypothetical protein